MTAQSWNLLLLLALTACTPEKTVGDGVSEVLCDGLDDDGDGHIDEGLGAPLSVSQFLDRDGDGYGDDATLRHHTCQLDPYILTGGDCDDTNPRLHPGAEELCNQQDEDCDGVADNGLLVEPFPLYPDADDDQYGAQDDSLLYGCLLRGYSADGGDCADHNPYIHPGVRESCDGIDNDCNGILDDSPAPLYLDIDQDGYGTDEVVKTSCGSASRFWTHGRGDCDDLDPNTHPGAEEVCDGHDRDCDGLLDDGAPQWADWWFPDADGDGMGDHFTAGVRACMPPGPGMVILPNDCDDTDPDPSHGATITSYSLDEVEGMQGWGTYDRPECVANHAFPTGHDVEGGKSLIEWDFDLDGEIDGHFSCENDDHCHWLLCEWDYENDGIIEGSWTYDYDDAGNQTYKAIDNNGDGQYEEQYRWGYDDAGHLILEAIDKDGDGLFESLKEWEYDQTDHLIYSSSDDESDTSPARVKTWEYDDAGRLIDHAEDLDGDGLFEDHSTWTYDEDGDLLYHSEALDGVLEVEQTRTCAPTDTGTRCDLFNQDGLSIESWVWDDRDRLVEHLVGTTRYEYAYNDADQLVLSVWSVAGQEKGREQWDDRGNIIVRHARRQDLPVRFYNTLFKEEWSYDDENRVISYHKSPEIYYMFLLRATDIWESTSYTSDGASRTEGERWNEVGLSSSYAFERDPQGRLLYREDTYLGNPTHSYIAYSLATLATWYDDQGRQTTARLVLADEHLDATFPVWSDTLGQASVGWDEFLALIALERTSASHEIVLGDDDSFYPPCYDFTWTRYASGTMAARQYNGCANDENEDAWFRNGLPRSGYYCDGYSVEEETLAYFHDNGHAYHKDREHYQLGEYGWEDCTHSEYSLAWSCP